MTAGSRKKCHIKYLNCLIFDRLHMYILLSHGWEKIGLVVSHCVLVCIIIRLLSLKIGSQFFPHTLQFNIIPNSKQDSLPHLFYWEVCILLCFISRNEWVLEFRNVKLVWIIYSIYWYPHMKIWIRTIMHGTFTWDLEMCLMY